MIIAIIKIRKKKLGRKYFLINSQTLLGAVTKLTNNCTPPLGVVAGGLIGYILGYIYYSLLKSTGNEKMLYLNELQSNNVVCSKPSEQQFKCAVYKNGQLISTNSTS